MTVETGGQTGDRDGTGAEKIAASYAMLPFPRLTRNDGWR